MRPKSIGNKVYLISASLGPLLALIYGRAVIYNPKILSSEIEKDGCDLKNNFITLWLPSQQTLKSLPLASMEWGGTREAGERAAMHSVLFLLFSMISSSSTELENRKTGFSTKHTHTHTQLKRCLPASSTVATPRFKWTSRETSSDLQWATALWMYGWTDGKRSRKRKNYTF